MRRRRSLLERDSAWPPARFYPRTLGLRAPFT